MSATRPRTLRSKVIQVHRNMSDRCHTCRPNWTGDLNALCFVSRANAHKLVGSEVSLEEYVRVSGVPAIQEARTRLNAHLAACGALPPHAASPPPPCCRST